MGITTVSRKREPPPVAKSGAIETGSLNDTSVLTVTATKTAFETGTLSDSSVLTIVGGGGPVANLWVDKDGVYGAPLDTRTRAQVTQTTPLATIAKAISLAQAGDLIYVVPAATKYPTITLDTSVAVGIRQPATQIEIAGFGSTRVDITQFLVDQCRNWKFTNFRTLNVGNGASNMTDLSIFRGNVGQIYISNCKAETAGMSFQRGGPYLVEDSEFAQPGGSPTSQGFWQGRGTHWTGHNYETNLDTSLADVTIRRCFFHGQRGEDAVEFVAGSGHTGILLIEDCTFQDLKQTSNAHTDCIYIDSAGNCTIRRCSFTNTDSCILIENLYQAVNSLTIENNLIDGLGVAGHQITIKNGAVKNNALTIANNTIVGDNETPPDDWAASIAMMQAVTGAKIYNNIINDFDAQSIYSQTSNDHRNNLIFTLRNGMTRSATDLSGKPTFVTSTDTDHELGPSSLGLNAGTNVAPAPATDRLGRARFGAVDIGCHERQGTVTVPGAPTGVSATGGNAQATVSFTPPTNTGGAAITGYRVTSSPGGLTATGAASPITITGLTNGTAYTFTVQAQNSLGFSVASSPSNSVTPVATASVPGQPTAVSATGGNAIATVTFTAPASNGGAAIDQYRVTSSPGNITAMGTSSPITVTGLTNGTTYTFTVAAHNSVGYSVESSPSGSVIPSAGGVGTPTLWVNNSTGNDTRTRAQAASQTTPFASISKAISVAQAGDLIAVVPTGTNYGAVWIEPSTHAATIRNPATQIEIQGWGGQVTCVDGGGTKGDLYLDTVTKWKFTNLTWGSFAGVDVRGNSGDLFWSFCRTIFGSQTYDAGASGTGAFTGPLLWEDCDFTADPIPGGETLPWSNRGIRIARTGTNPAQSFTIRRTVFHDMGGEDAIEITGGANNVLVEDCVFDKIIPDGFGFHTDCIYVSGGNNVIIRRNKFRNSDSTFAFYDATVTNLVVENNLIEIVNPPVHPADFGNCPGAIIRHNTFNCSIRIIDKIGSNFAVAQICNNISQGVGFEATPPGTFTPTATNNVGNINYASSLFVNSGPNPWDLAPGANPAVGTANPSFTNSTDLLQRARPFGAASDVGCYERQS